MKPRPIVSVVIPVFNAEKFIAKAIASALAQTVEQLEVIVVDDCSTDATVSIVKGINDERLLFYPQVANHGPSFCRNYAIDHAHGDWIAILDGDDWWESTRLDVLLRYATREHADVICDDLYLVKDDTSPPEYTYLKSREMVIGRLTEPKMISPLMMIRDDFGMLKPLIRADFLRENSIRYNDAYRYGEDFAFLLDCVIAGAKMMLYPVAYYYYRTGHISLSMSVENPIVQCNLLEELIWRTSYKQMPQIRQALRRRLDRKKLIVDEFHTKQLFQQKRYFKGISMVLQHPLLLVGYARFIKRKMVNS